MSSGELCPHDHAGACVLYNYTAIILVALPGNISACTQTLDKRISQVHRF